MWTSITGKTSAELRERCMQEHFRPLAEAILAKDPRVQSVLHLVGQFWCDEAEDAVHEEILPCEQRDPVWPDAAWPPGAECDSEASFLYLDQLFQAEGGYLTALSKLPHLDSNSFAITAFAAFCQEGCHQEMTLVESHLPYAIARRNGSSVDVQVVGRMLRPEWEDRFDVGFDEEGNELRGPRGD